MIKKDDDYILKILKLKECKHYVTGNTTGHINGNLYMKLPYYLEIMKMDLSEEDVYLLRFNEDNVEINDTWHSNLKSAIDQALYEYNVQPEDWEDV